MAVGTNVWQALTRHGQETGRVFSRNDYERSILLLNYWYKNKTFQSAISSKTEKFQCLGRFLEGKIENCTAHRVLESLVSVAPAESTMPHGEETSQYMKPIFFFFLAQFDNFLRRWTSFSVVWLPTYLWVPDNALSMERAQKEEAKVGFVDCWRVSSQGDIWISWRCKPW